MKRKAGRKIHIIEPHPDDAIGSASALCFHSELEVTIHTITGGGDERDRIKLTSCAGSKKYIKGHVRYLLPDYHWDLRVSEDLPYGAGEEEYRRLYGERRLSELTEVLESIVKLVEEEEASIAVPLGIMHPMHVLVTSLTLSILAKRSFPSGKIWIYVDHPYDLHSLRTGLYAQSVRAAEDKLGYRLARYDAVQADQQQAGKLIRKIYHDAHHAEFDGAFHKTLCGFYLPEKLSRFQQESINLQRLDVLMVAAQGYPYVKGGGMANVLYGLLKTGQNFMNHIRILLPWDGREPEYGNQMLRSSFRFALTDGSEVECVWETREYQGIIYELLFVPGVSEDSGDPLPYAMFAEVLLSKVIPRMDIVPNIIHCHDWQGGIIPFLMKTKYHKQYENIRSLYTIHFYGYQGICEGRELKRVLGLAGKGRAEKDFRKLWYLTPEAQKMAGCKEPTLVSFMNAGIQFADCVSTVSEGYAKELESYPAFQKGPKVTGIRNSILYDYYNPSQDSRLAANYDSGNFGEEKVKNKLALQKRLGFAVDAEIPLLCMVCRLEAIKGMDQVLLILPRLLRHSLQVVIMGNESHEGYYTNEMGKLKNQCPQNFCHLPFVSWEETEVYGASDMILVPSLSESCGTSQMIAMHYGAVPIVSCLSSLKDSVAPIHKERMDKGIGYLTYPDDCWMLYETLVEALKDFRDKKKWNYLVWKCMVTDFSWENGAIKKYALLYHRLLGN